MNSNLSSARKTALLATTALTLALAAAPAAYAQAGNKPVQVAQAEQTKSFAIPRGSLNDALAAFRLQSGLQVSADPAALRGVSSSGASRCHCRVSSCRRPPPKRRTSARPPNASQPRPAPPPKAQDYLSGEADFPGLPEPISLAVFFAEDGRSARAIWSRKG
jgi:hypothetical protein